MWRLLLLIVLIKGATAGEAEDYIRRVARKPYGELRMLERTRSKITQLNPRYGKGWAYEVKFAKPVQGKQSTYIPPAPVVNMSTSMSMETGKIDMKLTPVLPK